MHNLTTCYLFVLHLKVTHLTDRVRKKNLLIDGLDTCARARHHRPCGPHQSCLFYAFLLSLKTFIKFFGCFRLLWIRLTFLTCNSRCFLYLCLYAIRRFIFSFFYWVCIVNHQTVTAGFAWLLHHASPKIEINILKWSTRMH